MNPQTGEIWLVNLDPTSGDEMKKTRPAIIVSRGSIGVLALREIVPMTAWNDAFAGCDWLIRLDPDATNSLAKTSAADTFQVRSISCQRFLRKLGELSEEDLQRVANGLRLILDL
jgi:mRNA interferase MazF